MAKQKQNEQAFKAQFAFWDEWTGARFERVENPDMSKVKDRYSVCRFNFNTRKWEAVCE